MRNIQVCVFIISIISLSCTGRYQDPKPLERVQAHMGTYARVLVYGGNNRDIDSAFAKISELDNLLSDYNPNSQISNINQNAGIKPVKVDPLVIEVLEIAKNVASQTDGEFDPTIGALTIGVYRFGRETKVNPSADDISKAKALVNYKDLIIDSDTVYLENKGMMIDLGGIGKGYAVEKAVNVLKERGVKSGVVSLSGDIKVFGREAELAIKNPDSDASIATFSTGENNLAISTSGGYERSVNVDGESYHHLIVPKTGKPGNDFLSLTVVMKDNSAFADAYATALFIMGKDKMLEFIETHNTIGVFIIFADKKIYYNKTFTNLVNNLKIEENPSELTW